MNKYFQYINIILSNLKLGKIDLRININNNIKINLNIFIFTINIKVIINKKEINVIYSDNTKIAKFNCENSIEKPPANSPSDSIISKPIF